MLALQRRQSRLQNSPYWLVSEFEGEHNTGKPATGRGGVAVESDASAIDAVHFRSARLRGGRPIEGDRAPPSLSQKKKEEKKNVPNNFF